jgi:hypothetical protein
MKSPRSATASTNEEDTVHEDIELSPTVPIGPRLLGPYAQGIRRAVARRIVAVHAGTLAVDIPTFCPVCKLESVERVEVCPDLLAAIRTLLDHDETPGVAPPLEHPSEHIPIV